MRIISALLLLLFIHLCFGHSIFKHDFPTRTSRADDYGHFIHDFPSVVAFPETTSDVVKAVKYAADHNLPVICRGQGHNTYGYAQVSNGMVIDLSNMTKITVFDKYAKVEAGATWDQVAYYINSTTNKIFPSTTIYGGLSVGGGISTVGLGIYATVAGPIAEAVKELEVVTADGDVKICNRYENTDLFNAIRGGMGQFAVIVSAKFKILDKPLFTQIGYFQFLDLYNFVHAAKLAAERGPATTIIVPNNPDLINGFFGDGIIQGFAPSSTDPFLYFLTINKFVYNPATDAINTTGFVGVNAQFIYYNPDPVFALEKDDLLIAAEKLAGAFYAPTSFNYFFVPGDSDKLVKSIQLLLQNADGFSILDASAYNCKTFRNPFSPVRVEGEHVFSISLTRSVIVGPVATHQSDFISVGQLNNLSKKIYKNLTQIWDGEHVTAIPYGYFPYSALAHYGPAYGRVVEVKKRYDPTNLFSGGINLFYKEFENQNQNQYGKKIESSGVETSKVEAPKVEAKVDQKPVSN